MATHQTQIRNLERKYRRMKRQTQWEQKRQKLPQIFVTVLLIAAAVIAVWLLTKPCALDVPEALRVYVLDVGQGDSVLVQTETHSVLIDAGETDQGANIVQMLKALGVKRLDCVINSHPHADHIGGLPVLLEEIPVRALYMPEIPTTLTPTGYTFERVLEIAADKQIPLYTPECGETLPLGTANLTFLSVDNTQFDDLNDCSLGCRVECGMQRFFFAGDLESDGESAFLEADLITPVTVLKVSHHGSSSSTTQRFLDAAKPQLAFISCGAMNDYGHPTAQTLRALNAIGCTVYRTDLDGTVLFATDGTAMTVVSGFDFGFF